MTQLNPTVEEVSDVKTAVSEAVTNAIIHGYDNQICKVSIRCSVRGKELMVEVRDTGKGIENIKQAMTPMYTSKPELERSGMGFSFMEAFMDNVHVNGSNFESEVYPAGLCAERTLMFYAQANYADDPIETLAIASDPSERECYPCGQCRQVMVDVERRQGAPMRVIMSGGGTATAVDSAALLLPFTFVL